MTLIYELNQHVVHTFGGAARPRHAVGGIFQEFA